MKARTTSRSSAARRPAWLLVGACCAALSLAACNKSKEDSKSSKAKAKTEQVDDDETTSAVAPSAPEVPDEAVPTEEDFEEQAEREIPAGSDLSAELDKIEKELGLP